MSKLLSMVTFFLTITQLVFVTTSLTGQENSGDLPNIIVIHVDDLGWTDLSVQGSTYYETPHIDRLASDGIRFTDAYSAASVCSPTRAALLTGRYPARVGITDWIRAEFQGGEIPPDKQNPTDYVGEPDKKLLTPPNPLWMELEEITVSELLEEAGYVNIHIGKWHLGGENWYPEHQGFHVNIGGADFGQPPSFFDPYYSETMGSIPTLEPREEGEYLTDREAYEAVHAIKQYRDQPFFLHFANYAVHTPIQAKDDLIERYNSKPPTNHSNAVYAAMIHSLDEAVGKIVNTLKELDLYENTLIIFKSDNGGLVQWDVTDNSPLRSGKGFPYEGGIRVPLIITWPGVLGDAVVSYEPVSSIDIFPTLAEVAGVELPSDREIDGLSLVEHLKSGAEKSLERDYLIWHFPHYRQGHTVPPYSIIRNGNWKLIKWWEGPEFELYDLHRDIGETIDLAEKHPEQVEALNGQLLDVLVDMVAKLPIENPNYEHSSD